MEIRWIDGEELEKLMEEARQTDSTPLLVELLNKSTSQQRELRAVLKEAKEAIMKFDLRLRTHECYGGGIANCQCTLCKIKEVLKRTK